jgi:signal peptidase
MSNSIKTRIHSFLRSDNYWVGLARDIVFVLIIVGILASIVYSYSGTLTPLVAVESGSMEPHINIGDIVFIQKSTDIVTYQEGKSKNYATFGNYGDVIVYKPNGDAHKTPIIHRAMYWVNVGDALPNGQRATQSGYVTKGDHNLDYDQPFLYGGAPIVYPVKPEWIVGKAKFSVPYLGNIRLILPTIIEPLLSVTDTIQAL